jgi:hypothetical protein
LERWRNDIPCLIRTGSNRTYEQGKIFITPGGEGLVIKNYLKPNHLVTLVFSRAQRAVQSIEVSSCLNDPGDAVTTQAVFAKLPDGTNHVSNATINGVSKQLTVLTQNLKYENM